MLHSRARQAFASHPSVPIKPLSPSFLPLRRSLARTPAGVMLRCSLLTFPGLAAEAFQIAPFIQTLPWSGRRWRWTGQDARLSRKEAPARVDLGRRARL